MTVITKNQKVEFKLNGLLNCEIIILFFLLKNKIFISRKPAGVFH